MVVRNRRYLELYGLGPNDAQPGTPLLDMMRQSIDRGMHTGKATAEKFFADFIKRVTVDREPVVHRRLTSGRLLAVRHEPMENGGWVGTYEDITERERAAEELKEQHSRFDIALNNMAHGLCMFDQNMHLIVSNKRYAEMFNLDPAKVRPGMSVYDVIGLSFAARQSPPPRFHARRVLQQLCGLAARGQPDRTPASCRRAHHQGHARADGGRRLGRDPRGHHRAAPREESIEHLARHDALTELPNRVLFREKMAEGLAPHRVARRERWRCSASISTISRASTTRSAIRSATSCSGSGRGAPPRRGRRGPTSLARLGGDEFALLQIQLEQPTRPASSRAASSRRSPSRSHIDGQVINSAPASASPWRRTTASAADDLMKNADLALYRAKAEGRGTYRFFEPDMDARIQERRAHRGRPAHARWPAASSRSTTSR